MDKTDLWKKLGDSNEFQRIAPMFASPTYNNGLGQDPQDPFIRSVYHHWFMAEAGPFQNTGRFERAHFTSAWKSEWATKYLPIILQHTRNPVHGRVRHLNRVRSRASRVLNLRCKWYTGLPQGKYPSRKSAPSGRFRTPNTRQNQYNLVEVLKALVGLRELELEWRLEFRWIPAHGMKRDWEKFWENTKNMAKISSGLEFNQGKQFLAHTEEHTE
ncbi:conserved hypothetical protein [Histoplasma capsulatum G186AR]|uniref:Uncharacterized protein n=1 Tax=Ajellomyces capsulatus (strain G186AR / H82 / ATCC MYA-2454 / RMSCC 2432) TaxID=447093 RepID=C0NMX0_AJECG|nr:uncharacterized protein HCBG_04097 [Histoplasma capsulatum G186AR]EEH07218.1 conserved hypothetical protein [Histoplasma capsulatum G186AR]